MKNNLSVEKNNLELNDSNKYLMPAEWHPHAATWCCFPFDEQMWYGHLADVRKEYSKLILAISKFEPVHLFVNELDDSVDIANSMFQNYSNIQLHLTKMDDVWYRDNGPIFVKTADKKILPTKWNFNAWGNKYNYELDNKLAYKTIELLGCQHVYVDVIFEGGGIEVNGRGIALTTRQCLLNKNRNISLNQDEIEKILNKYLGIKNCIWLNNGLQDDHTDGHIDTIVRFINENTILCSYSEDRNEQNYKNMEENLKILTDAAKDYSLNIVKIPLPKNKLFLNSLRIPCTYANFYMSDKFVFVPMYDDPNDAIVLDKFKSLFPKHYVEGLSSKFIILGGGSFHCLTQQQPRGELVC